MRLLLRKRKKLRKEVVSVKLRAETERGAGQERGSEAEARIGDTGVEVGIEVTGGVEGIEEIEIDLGKGEIEIETGEEIEVQKGEEKGSIEDTEAGPRIGRVETARARTGRVTTKHGRGKMNDRLI